MPIGIGGLKSGDIQDTLIHNRDGRIGGFTRLNPVHMQDNIQRSTRIGFSRNIKCYPQTVCAGINAGMGQTHCTGGIVARIGVHRTDDRRGDIGTRAPLIGHRKGDCVFTLGNLDRFHMDQAVRHHGDQGRPRIARNHAQGCGIADLILLCVQRKLQHIRRVASRGRGIPSGIKARGR